MRHAEIQRQTRETNISLAIAIDGAGTSQIVTPIGFFNHMLETLAKHGRFDLQVQAEGDMHVDAHHLVEDTGIALGCALRQALGDKRGINRAGFFIFPMDEALAQVALDLADRGFLKYCARFDETSIGDFPVTLMEDFLYAFAANLGMSLHVNLVYGRSAHHGCEAIFKALARALRSACAIDPALAGEIPSTKGVL